MRAMLFALMLVPSLAAAEEALPVRAGIPLGGSDFVALCRDHPAMAAGFAVAVATIEGYHSGTAPDEASVAGNFCMPADLTTADLQTTACSFVGAHPKEAEYLLASAQIERAFTAKWPCVEPVKAGLSADPGRVMNAMRESIVPTPEPRP